MKTNKKNELKNKMLTPNQAETVKEMIIASMRGVYTDKGSLPPANDFEKTAGKIADKIIHNSQISLMQVAVFAKAVKNSKPLKKNVRN